MNNIMSVFRPDSKALIAYLTAGYPNIETTQEAASILADRGCDIIELGIPFSDPLADGATIQKASYEALQRGVTTSVCLELAHRLHQQIAAPLLFMTYYNPVFSFGLEAFCQDSAQAGISGIIIPDMPPEEGTELEAVARKHNLSLTYLLAPTSTEERISTIVASCQGFIYLVSLTGVTGARQILPLELEDFVKRVKQKAHQPLCVGFGISTPEQASRVAKVADGVIVGSRLIQLIEEDATLYSLKAFTSSLREALDQK